MSKLFRVFVQIIIGVALLNGFGMLFLSLRKIVFVIINLLDPPGGAHHTPGIEMVESLDLALVALVFMLFAVGFAKLFLPESRMFKEFQLEWMHVSNFSDLKLLLWDTILLSIVVSVGADIIARERVSTWEDLVIPGSVTLLALGAKLIHRPHEKHSNP